MGQSPCNYDSKCEAFATCVDRSASGVKFESDIMHLYQYYNGSRELPDDQDEYYDGSCERTQKFCVDRTSIIVPSFRRSTSRDTCEERAVAQFAMAEVAVVIAEGTLTEIQTNSSGTNRMCQKSRSRSQCDLESSDENTIVHAEEGFREDSRLAVWYESASEEAAEEAEERAEWVAMLEAERAAKDREHATHFLAAEGFASVKAGRRNGSCTVYPLHAAVEKNDAEAIRCLLFAKADLSQRIIGVVSRRQTPQQMAMRRNRQGSHEKVILALKTAATSL